MMSNNIPDYSKIYELTKRRLKGMRKLAQKKKNFGMADEILLALLGNMNQRLYTMFYLINNNISDGVSPLQRTFFEMQVAYHAMIHSENKEKFSKFYLEKKSFETVNKVNRFLLNDKNTIHNEVEPWEKEYISYSRDIAHESLKEANQSVKLKGNKQFKLWFELACDKTLKELSDEFWDSYKYYSCYDEPSNWVHPQRLELNINVETFDMVMHPNFYNFMMGALLQDANFLYQAMADFAAYIQVTNSIPLAIYSQKQLSFLNNLKEAVGEVYSNSYDLEQAEIIKEKAKNWFQTKKEGDNNMLF